MERTNHDRIRPPAKLLTLGQNQRTKAEIHVCKASRHAFQRACDHLKRVDRIVVMENGRIIEEGNHNGLLDRGGHYATLYNTYFRPQSLAYVEKARELVGND